MALKGNVVSFMNATRSRVTDVAAVVVMTETAEFAKERVKTNYNILFKEHEDDFAYYPKGRRGTFTGQLIDSYTAMPAYKVSGGWQSSVDSNYQLAGLYEYGGWGETEESFTAKSKKTGIYETRQGGNMHDYPAIEILEETAERDYEVINWFAQGVLDKVMGGK